MQQRCCPKGQGILPKEGPAPNIRYFVTKVLSLFTCFFKGFRRAFNKCHPVPATKVILILLSFRGALNKTF